MLTLTHHGAVTGVTGSCHELALHGPGGAKAGVRDACEQTQDLTPMTL